ncbi:MAG: hypothetical protein BJ554DRAFT_328 [Olpidium bornovanus]|uniref:Uncharacterized protein n=1 Tax=Olpidium bornovanus TaxID=278681 RepID=A0A8H7ZU48_9FUNG|nr:MAG: hypothetical protein BJ554DRAFT_328 [Olpidium bornovanus]
MPEAKRAVAAAPAGAGAAAPAAAAASGRKAAQAATPAKPAAPPPPLLPRPSLQKRSFGPDGEPRSTLPVVHAIRLRSAGKVSKLQKIASFRTSLPEGIDINTFAQPVWFRRKSAFTKAEKEREEEREASKTQEQELAGTRAEIGEAAQAPAADAGPDRGPQPTVAPYGNTAPKDKANLFKKKWRVSYRHKPDPEKVEFDKEQKDPFMIQSGDAAQRWKADYIHLARMNTLLFFTDDGFKVTPNAKRYNFLRQAPPGWTEEKATEAEEQRKNYEAALDRKMRQGLSRKDAEKPAPEDAKMSAKERAYWANKNRPRAAVAAARQAHQRLRIAQEREDEVDALDYEEVFEDDEEGDPFPEMLDDDARADRVRKFRSFAPEFLLRFFLCVWRLPLVPRENPEKAFPGKGQREKRQYLADRFEEVDDGDLPRSKLNKEGKAALLMRFTRSSAPEKNSTENRAQRRVHVGRQRQELPSQRRKFSFWIPAIGTGYTASFADQFLEFDGMEKTDAKDAKAAEGDKDRAKPSGWAGPDAAQPAGASKKPKLSARSGKASSKSAAEKQQQMPAPPPRRKVSPPGGGGGLKKKREDSPDGSNKKQKFARPLPPGPVVSPGPSSGARPRGIIANRR